MRSISGQSLLSFGRHCAQLNGVPIEVIQRADIVLEDIHSKKPKRHVISEKLTSTDKSSTRMQRLNRWPSIHKKVTWTASSRNYFPSNSIFGRVHSTSGHISSIPTVHGWSYWRSSPQGAGRRFRQHFKLTRSRLDDPALFMCPSLAQLGRSLFESILHVVQEWSNLDHISCKK